MGDDDIKLSSFFRVKRSPYQPNSGSMFEPPNFYIKMGGANLGWEKEVFFCNNKQTEVSSVLLLDD